MTKIVRNFITRATPTRAELLVRATQAARIAGISLVAVAVLRACSLAPKYEPPKVEDVTAFKEAGEWMPAAPTTFASAATFTDQTLRRRPGRGNGDRLRDRIEAELLAQRRPQIDDELLVIDCLAHRERTGAR